MSNKKQPRKNAGKDCAAKKRSKITRSTSPIDRFYRIAESMSEDYLGDAAYLRDEQILGAVMSEFSLDEAMKMDDYELGAVRLSCGTPNFTVELLPHLAKAVRRRNAKLDKLLDAVFDKDQIGNTPPEIEKRIREHAHTRYDGELEYSPLLRWVAEEIRCYYFAVKAMHVDDAQSAIDFAEIYRLGYHAAFDGVWDILKDCRDLGADEYEAREVVQRALIKIWKNTYEWSSLDATASIPTRIRAFARFEAIGWRDERIKARNLERELRGDYSECDFKGAKSGKKPDLSYFDNKRYDSAAA
jgi:hypothetical protein